MSPMANLNRGFRFPAEIINQEVWLEPANGACASD
jgi:hypothetical protein